MFYLFILSNLNGRFNIIFYVKPCTESIKDILCIFLPSEYSGGSNLRNGEPLAPQAGCLTLLQAPEGVLYLLGGQGLSDRTLHVVLIDCILFARLKKENLNNFERTIDRTAILKEI